ncbi:unnamed protein product [Citrullus colocynthis]|uniref:Uncharacterized protein n=1 Tax=Citrullus colocynthis TaxID=252529 RepID=A0ABP0YCH8_9ROSI
MIRNRVNDRVVTVGRAGRRNRNASGKKAEGLADISEASLVIEIRIRHVGIIHPMMFHHFTRPSCRGKPRKKKKKDENGDGIEFALEERRRRRHCVL